MDFEIINNKDEAKKTWDTLSPHLVLDDEWDFRYSFIKYLPYELYFVVGKGHGDPVCLLPLQKNNGQGLMPPYYKGTTPFLEFFGGDDTDDNKILQKDSAFSFQDFQNFIQLPTYLAPLAQEYAHVQGVSFYENKYFINISQYTTYQDFLTDMWSSSSKKKLLQQIRRLYRDHIIEVLENNYEDIELMSDLNTQRFANKSSFSYSYRKRIFEDLIGLYDVVMLTLVIDGKKEAVSYGIHYKDTYVGMNSGVNNSIEDLPKLLIMLQIDKAIECGCTVFDAGKGSSGWKEQFRFNRSPQYQLILPKTT